MAHLIHNEQIKLAATWFNNFSVGVGVGGTLLPFLNQSVPKMLLGPFEHPAPQNYDYYATVIAAWTLAFVLHLLGKHRLKKLREEVASPQLEVPTPNDAQNGVKSSLSLPVVLALVLGVGGIWHIRRRIADKGPT